MSEFFVSLSSIEDVRQFVNAATCCPCEVDVLSGRYVIDAKEEVFTALSDEVNSELDVKWSEMKSYDEGGSGYLFLMLLAAMLALACFNIWRKVRRKTRNMY